MRTCRLGSLACLFIFGCGGDTTPAATTLGTFSGGVTSDGSGAESLDGSGGSEAGSDDGATAGDGDSDTGDGDGTTTSGDGDGTTSGDGDGTTTSGDGDGTTTSGDGDGTTTSGDGDGTTTSGDGDGTTTSGDGTTGDGDGTTSGDGTTGDGTTGDGDGTTSGDGTSGDGDGTTTGDGTTGDGDGTTSGDGTTGDGDGTTGDGDGTTSGDGTTGDGDGTTAGDGTTGDGDGTAGDGDGTSTGDGTTGDGTTGDGDGTTSGDGDGTTGDGDGDGTTGGPMPCAVQPPTVEFEPPNIVYVLDKSGSMMSTICFDFPTCSNVMTFWEILYNSLQTVVTTYEDTMKFGVKWFPTETICPDFDITTSCKVEPGLDVVVPAIAGPGQWTSISSVLPGPMSNIAATCVTPGQDGYDRASEWVATNLVPGGETTAMVLFFDGALSDGRPPGADCNESAGPPLSTDPWINANTVAGLTASISANAAQGIDTYVIGFGLSDPTLLLELDQYAMAGNTDGPGAPFYFEATDPNSLGIALDQIATAVSSCDISVTVTSLNPELTEVDINGTIYTEILPAQCGTMDGFYYIDGPPDYLEIRLCGQACTDFTGDPTATEVNFFCTAG